MENLKKYFLVTIVTSLIISAAAGIWMILLGDSKDILSLKDLSGNIFLTTLCIGIFGLTSLCAAALYEKGHAVYFSIFGIAASFLALISTVLNIWGYTLGDPLGNRMASLWTMSIVTAQISLLLLVKAKSNLVWLIQKLTIIAAALTGALIILQINSKHDLPEQLFLTLIILNVLGTLTTPILNKIYSGNK